MLFRSLLAGDAVVATVMSNLGLELAMQGMGLPLVRTAVGDRQVLEEMERRGCNLGGEQSGHVIFREISTTGDGILTGLMVLDVLRRSSAALADLADAAMTSLPQVLKNVRVSGTASHVVDAVAGEVAAVEADLGDHGRVLLRSSGTEPLVRVMVEAPTADQAHAAADRLVAAVERASAS